MRQADRDRAWLRVEPLFWVVLLLGLASIAVLSWVHYDWGRLAREQVAVLRQMTDAESALAAARGGWDHRVQTPDPAATASVAGLLDQAAQALADCRRDLEHRDRMGGPPPAEGRVRRQVEGAGAEVAELARIVAAYRAAGAPWPVPREVAARFEAACTGAQRSATLAESETHALIRTALLGRDRIYIAALGLWVMVLVVWAAGLARAGARRRRAEQRTEHLNAVLRGVRGATQLAARERDLQALLDGVCRSLVEVGRYDAAWLVARADGHYIAAAAEAGPGGTAVVLGVPADGETAVSRA